LKVYTKTDIGNKRTENQDRVWAQALDDGAVAVVLCDGMGGENAGSIASELTISCVSERIIKGFRPNISRNSLRNLLITSITAANSLVFDKATKDPEKRGMGTTCIAAVLYRGMAYILNVGDSRVYRFFDDSMQQITKDHTYVRRLVEKGQITEEESRVHPDRNCITRAVGAEDYITPDYFELDYQEGNIFLFCTDGLHAYGNDEDIAEIIANTQPSKICDQLVQYALKNGGKDNITVCICQC
jgi:protein phosphatase